MAIDLSVYERQRRNINDDFTTQSATNAYSRFLSQQRGERRIADYGREYGRATADLSRAYGRQTADYTKQYQRQLPNVAASWATAGSPPVGCSPASTGGRCRTTSVTTRTPWPASAEDQATGMGRLGEDRTLGINRSYADTALERNQFDLNQANFDAEHNDALYSIEAERAVRSPTPRRPSCRSGDSSGNRYGLDKGRQEAQGPGLVGVRRPGGSVVAGVRQGHPTNAAAIKYARENNYGQATPGGGFDSGVTGVRDMMRTGFNPTGMPPPPPGAPGGGSGGGGRRGYGGGGGGGGNNFQAQLDFLLPILAQGNYMARPADKVREAVNTLGTTAQGQSNVAWDAVDKWLAAHQSNPYANLNFAPAQAYGGGTNPEDGGYGAFGNVAKLLGANQIDSNTSRGAESQFGRATGVNTISGAMQQQLAAIADQEYQQQLALDTERRQAILELAGLVGGGAKAPGDFMSRLGLV